MNSQLYLLAFAGLVVLLSIPIMIIIVAVVWGSRIAIPRYNFWLAAGIGFFAVFVYLVLVLTMSKSQKTELFISNIAVCILGTSIALAIYFLGAFISAAFIRSLTDKH